MSDNIKWNHTDSLTFKLEETKKPFNLDEYIEKKVKECIESYRKEENQNDGNR